tara:strand:+ start:879 stop:1076 length:198 start_codon:yes stop_codon:yes gene_type:complete
MRHLEIEHEGTMNAVKAKLRRIKKGSPFYFISRKWKIHTNNDSLVGTNLESYAFEDCILTKERTL